MAERLVVIGGDATGMSAASQARRRRGPEDLEIVVFERGRHTSYSACGIPYWIGGAVDNVARLVVRSPEEHRIRDIDVHLHHEVEAIDPQGGEVRVRDLASGQEKRVGFDHLVIATGAHPVRPKLPGIDAEGIYGVQTLDDGEAVLTDLERKPRRAVVVGGGYIGVEMAEAMVKHGLKVTLVDQAAEPMSTLDPDMGRLVHQAMENIGIDVVTEAGVEEFEADSRGRVRAVATKQGTFPADVVVLGLGVRPNAALAQEAGLSVGAVGGICTDLRMRVTGQERIWAGGDCVEVLNLVSGRPQNVALGTHANKHGRVIGINIGGGYATFPGVVGTAVSKVCDLEIARTGLRESDARQVGFEYLTAMVTSTSRAGYFPGSSPMTVKMIAEWRTGLLLGVQIVGRAAGAAKRIDAAAVALWNKMTVEEMTSLDLGYAPPFSPVWDPILLAARKAAEAIVASCQG
jgi:NADPH-dependent 2,4-dienoyl-CoA reductase/sulfur reductase-like enzyme